MQKKGLVVVVVYLAVKFDRWHYILDLFMTYCQRSANPRSQYNAFSVGLCHVQKKRIFQHAYAFTLQSFAQQESRSSFATDSGKDSILAMEYSKATHRQKLGSVWQRMDWGTSRREAY